MQRSLLAVLSLSILSTLAACSAGDSSEAPEDDEGALAVSGLAATRRVAFDMPASQGRRSITIAARSKVAKVLAAFKSPTGDEVLPRCQIGPATKITFFDASGEEVATGSFVCFRGTITETGSTRPKKFYYRPGDLGVLDEPLLPADVLWGITQIDVEKLLPPARKVAVRDGAKLAKVLDAFDIEQPYLQGARQTRCAPDRRVTFFREHDEVALSTYLCGSATASTKVTANFSTFERDGNDEGAWKNQGQISVDARAIDRVFD